ncbi:MAG: type II toxin-antitoxin system VapC family toxin [Anaerolineae bacterium]|nr:type II toxin-antitoxin system VapC family toxin [Anaerolineae bacterium]NUQ05767.1 type II toxin-antitoxin system VapC family toxin [Anaerolineae bacterium]
MKYLLDTNTCVRYLNRRSPGVIAHFQAVRENDIAVCSVVKGELYLGALKSQTPDTTMTKQRAFAERFASLPFDDDAAEHYARIRAALEFAGMPIGANDLMIAAIALAHNLTLVTHNIREFGRIAGLRIEDWESDDSN